jgi:hypothetical protein
MQGRYARGAAERQFLSPVSRDRDRSSGDACRPSSETIETFNYVWLFEANDEVVLTYEATRTGLLRLGCPMNTIRSLAVRPVRRT